MKRSWILPLFAGWLATVLTPGQEVSGIGALLRKEGPAVIIQDFLPDSPAALSKAIHRGDRIIAVAQGDDPPIKLTELSLEQAVRQIRGPKGSTVRLTLVSPGKEDSEARVVSVVRGELKGLARDEAQASERLMTLILLKLAIGLPRPF
jgi:carboxyl-terminal processing protease